MSKPSWFGKWINRRLSRERNFLMAVVGETGVGKSYLALRIAEKYDYNKDFDERHMIFNPSEFLEAVNSLGNNCFIVFDEAGVFYNARQYQSDVNRLLSFVLQSFRYKYLNVIFTMPVLGFMDYAGRSLLHAVVRVTDRGQGIVYRVQKNYLGRDIYTPKVGVIKTDLPSKVVIEAYENKKDQILSERYKMFKSELEREEKSLRFVKPIDIARMLIDNGEIDKFKENNKVNAHLLSGILDININKAYSVKKIVESGYLTK